MRCCDKIIVLLIFVVRAIRADKCPGYKQNVLIPKDYIKYLPDAHYTGNVSKVELLFYIKRIRMVKEER